MNFIFILKTEKHLHIYTVSKHHHQIIQTAKLVNLTSNFRLHSLKILHYLFTKKTTQITTIAVHKVE